MRQVSAPEVLRISTALMLSLLLISGESRAQQSAVAGSPQPLMLEIDSGNRREVVAPAEGAAAADGKAAKAIGFITTNDAFCFQPDAARNECFVNWRLHSVSAGTDNMTRLRILLAGRLVVNMSGFFQNSMSYQFGMVNPGGFKVLCGPPSAADPLLGAIYSYQVSATDSNNLTANNFGSVQCPAFAP